MFSKRSNFIVKLGIQDGLFMTAIIVIALVFYAFTLKGIYGNPPSSAIKNNLDRQTKPFELSPERDRYLLVQSLANNKSFALSQALADAAYPDVGYYAGRFYIFFAPGISLFALPFYYLGSHYHLEQVASYFMVTLFACGNLLILFRITRDIFKLPMWASLLSVVIFGFGSTSWSYAVTLYQHHPTTFFIMSGFYAAWKYSKYTKFSWLWGIIVWLNYGLAILIDYPNVILMFPVMLYFFVSSWNIIREKQTVKISFRLAFIATSVLFVAVTGWHLYYNYTNFGSPTTVSGSLTGYKDIKERQLFTKKNGQAQIQKIAASKQPVHFFKEEHFATSSEILLFSVDRGIFLYSPIFIIGLLGMLYALRKISIESAILIAIAGADFFLYSSWGDPWGGYAFGPRYLIPAMASLSIFTAIWISQLRYLLIGKIIAFILFMYSSAIALLGVLTTNAIPPKVEAVYLHTQWGFPLNITLLIHGQSSSFIYNTFFSNRISLIGYYLVLYEIMLVIGYVILFIVPMYDRKSTRKLAQINAELPVYQNAKPVS